MNVPFWMAYFLFLKNRLGLVKERIRILFSPFFFILLQGGLIEI